VSFAAAHHQRLHADGFAVWPEQEEWVQWLQFARDEGPTIEELEANQIAKEQRLQKARDFDAHDAELQLQEAAHRGPGDGGYSAAFEHSRPVSYTSAVGGAAGGETAEEKQTRAAGAAARPTPSTWGGAPKETAEETQAREAGAEARPVQSSWGGGAQP